MGNSCACIRQRNVTEAETPCGSVSVTAEKETVVGQTLLQTGKTKSCGCLQATVIYDNLKLCEGTSVTLLEFPKKEAVKE